MLITRNCGALEKTYNTLFWSSRALVVGPGCLPRTAPTRHRCPPMTLLPTGVSTLAEGVLHDETRISRNRALAPVSCQHRFGVVEMVYHAAFPLTKGWMVSPYEHTFFYTHRRRNDGHSQG